MANYEGGVWRTIRGAHVFIRDGEDLDSALKRVRRQGYTDNDFRKQEEKIAQLNKEYNALLDEEIDLQKDWNQWEEPGYELESTAYDRSQKEEELSEAREKYGEMSKSPYVERKLKMGRENYDKLMGKEDIELKKGDYYINEKGTVVNIKDIDEKGQVIHSFQSSPTEPERYRTFNKENVSAMLKQNGYTKVDSTLTKAENKEGQKIVNAGYLKNTNIAKEQYNRTEKEIEDSIKSLYIYQDEKNMGSLRENPLGKYYDKYGKENVDRVWKKMDDKYAIIKGTAMDSEGLRYNELVEKDKHSPEAIQYLQNRTEQAYKNYYGDSRKYNEEIAQAKTEFKNFGREARAREIDKINEGTPLQDMANDRIKEKQNTLANDKAMLEGMKRNGINEVQGWTQKDFENRINKNEDYLDVAKNNKEGKNNFKQEIKEDLEREYLPYSDSEGNRAWEKMQKQGYVMVNGRQYNKSNYEEEDYAKSFDRGSKEHYNALVNSGMKKEDAQAIVDIEKGNLKLESDSYGSYYNKTPYDAKEQYEPKYSSVVDRYNRDENFRNMLKQEHEKTIETTKKEISSYFDMTEKDRESLVGGQDDLYKAINEDYGNINREEFDKLYNEEAKRRQDNYESKVFGSDVRKADEQMKKVFGENFKYDEEKRSQATIERFKERKGKTQDTYTKTGNIRYSAFGIERTPEGDFSDDGTRFTAYRLPNGMEMTVAKASDEIFMSVRNPYNKEIKYEEYSKLPHYNDLDMYNGVRKDSVDLNKLIDSSNKFKNEYDELLKSKGLKPETRSNKEIRIESIRNQIENNQTSINYYRNSTDYSRWRYNKQQETRLMKKNDRLRKELEKLL